MMTLVRQQNAPFDAGWFMEGMRWDRGGSESKNFAGHYCNEIEWTVGDTFVSINFLALKIIF